MIRNIVFDMGQVLIRFDQKYFIHRLGIDDPADEKLLMTQVFLSAEWVSMDWGDIAEDEAARRICTRLPERLHDAARKLISMWDRPILLIDGMYELVDELKQAGYGIYLLSNASVRQREYWPRVPCHKFFDGTLISSDIGSVKPERRIYTTLTERFGLAPEECFLVDDSPLNVVGALRCGWSGAIFRGDAAQLRAEMRRAGIRVGGETA